MPPMNRIIACTKLYICCYLTGLMLVTLARQITFAQSKQLIILFALLFVCLFVFLINRSHTLRYLSVFLALQRLTSKM